ncbi:hypothetical protein DL96DRAFT_327697 [Flagelloscypha sp. PMI_526]|nr:hypothetical protein DL96DRAFT_327697 [Flagelloscypha sp. PMI_526]
MAALPPPAVIIEAATHLQAAKYYQVASYVMLVFDHMITFGDEVERIWMRPMSGASLLFLINRYLTPIQFAIILVAFNDPAWSEESFCDRFVSFEGYSTVGLVAVCSAVMILRIFALYGRNYYVLGFLIAVLITQITVSSYGLSLGFRVPLPPIFVGCIFTGPAGSMFPAVWYTPAITDFIIFCLTVYRARIVFKDHGSSVPTMQRFVKDGVLYFLLIFSANLLNVLIYSFAVDDLKAVGASFSQLITSVMISRLVLNLRAVGDAKTASENTLNGSSYGMAFAPRLTYNSQGATTKDDFMSRTIGNLGEDLLSVKPSFSLRSFVQDLTFFGLL